MSLNSNSPHPKGPNALREEETLRFWTEKRIFEKSLETPGGEAPKGEFVFYDGPPFANGSPHYGHMLPGTIKDLIPRYKTMQGYRVPRNWGWDCHGLPVENLIEKELGLKTKKEIVEYGVEKFNEAARESVLRYAHEWREIIPRSGRFVDMEHDYKTMDSSYTESVWWAFKNLYDKGLVSEGYKAMHLCPRCETTLANFEVNQGYKDITDISVFVKFKLREKKDTYLLAWTTTPWTLPGNVALAVGADIDYVEVVHEGATYILAESRLVEVFGEKSYTIGKQVKGSALVGLAYEPLFSYYDNDTLKNHANGFKVYAADFVTTEDGTGIVHIAPAFGEDDMMLGQKHELPFIQHVAPNGAMKPEVADFAGLQAKPKENHESTDVEIIKYLAKNGTLFGKKKIVHSYPHCWRCDTPLLNYASSSWFVKVTAVKDRLLANNQKTEWVPEHMRDGRFGKWLEGARDWAISRSRFWGAPIPVWRCPDCAALRVVGSVDEIKGALPAAKNEYTVMRHGEAEHLVRGITDCGAGNFSLTEKGKRDVEKNAQEIGSVDLIVSSPLLRTRETAEIVAKVIGYDASQIVYDDRLRDVGFGVLEGRPIPEYRGYFNSIEERFTKKPEGGENLNEIKRRMMEVVYDLEQKYAGKKILIVSHESPLWMLATGALGGGVKEAIVLADHDNYIDPAGVRKLDFVPLPHNADYELDLHRPYIDAVQFPCACGGVMGRVPEVFDCWFESGAMPFASRHYPFENKEAFEKHFPADFIAESIDQTRGWFYALMVLSTALFDKPTFKQVVVSGYVLAEDGQKMSKRLKNYPELAYVLDTYGADALRFYLMSSQLPRAEDLNFAESGVKEVGNKIVGRLLNVLTFYEQNKSVKGEPSTDLDAWIMSRLHETTVKVTISLEAYEVDAAMRPLADFIEDLSVWYIRRSRKNFSPEITRVVLETLAKLMAPVTPFLAEHIYQAVKAASGKESVHLESWPKAGTVDESVLSKMAKTRELVEAALAARMAAKTKVRQPLAALFVHEPLENFYADLVADEVNVKQVQHDETREEVKLDLVITPELALEGEYRELVRTVQDMRKARNLAVADRITLALPRRYSAILEKFDTEFRAQVGADRVLVREGEIDISLV